MGLGIPFVGNIIEKTFETIVPGKAGEFLGDLGKIGAGILLKDPGLIFDGVVDAGDNVLEFAEKKLDLGPAEPGEPESFWKKAGRAGLDLLKKQQEISKSVASFAGVGGGGGGGMPGLSAA